MTQRERQILELIEADPMITQEELAEKLGITRSSVAVHISNLTKKGPIAGRGYVLRSGTYVVVVGGANVDICGRSWDPLVQADSNPGLVGMSIGGVGRNIAHNLGLLGVDVRMLTACGDDLNGQRLCAGIFHHRAAGQRRVKEGKKQLYNFDNQRNDVMQLAKTYLKGLKNYKLKRYFATKKGKFTLNSI